MSDLQSIIEAAFENRAEITPANVDPAIKNAVLEAIDLIDSGSARVAEPTTDGDEGPPCEDTTDRAVACSGFAPCDRVAPDAARGAVIFCLCAVSSVPLGNCW